MTPPQARVLERAAASPRTGEPGVIHDPGRTPSRDLGQLPGRPLAAVTLAVIRREWLAVLFGLSAIFAAVTALISFNAPERRWGELAAVSYAVAAATALVARRRGITLAVLISLAGAALAPLAWMAVTGLAQPEVGVIVRSAQMFLHQGTPYASPAALAAAHTWKAYDPYLPALIVFGMLRALSGGLLTDPRIWFGVAFVITFGAALRVAGVPRPAWWTVLVTASPVIALPLAVGGDDLPVLGLICLGLALAGRAAPERAARERAIAERAVPGRWYWPVAAGLALGLAAAMKATAWPALAVVLVLLARRAGWRAVAGFSTAVAGLVAISDGPTVAANPAATVANTIRYPMGLAKAASPAASQLPGHLLAGIGTWGHGAALALMVAAGAGVVASLFIRPPKDAQGAGWRLVLGFTLLFGLAPASRVGYFVYPLGLAALLLLARIRPGRAAAGPGRTAVGPDRTAAGSGRTAVRPGRAAEGLAGGSSVDPVTADEPLAVPHAADRLQLATTRLDDGP